MESNPSSIRPTKRRRTKGVRRLVEGDDNLATGIMVKTTIRETVIGPVEERTEIPIWENEQAPAPGVPKLQSEGFQSDDVLPDYGPIDGEYPEIETDAGRTGNTTSQAYYIHEFVKRVDPLLKALLSRETLPENTTCNLCSERNIAIWRCKDCAAASILCRGCIRNTHFACPTHRIEVWTGTHFRPAELWEVGVYILIPHHVETPLCNTLKFQQTQLANFHTQDDLNERKRLSNGLHTRSLHHDLNELHTGGLHHGLHQNQPEEFSNSIYKQNHDNIDICNEATYPDDYIPRLDDPRCRGNVPSNAIPSSDWLNNQFVRIVDITGIHNIALVYCTCRGKENTHSDLIAAGYVPTSFSRYRTLFTHGVLNDFRLSNLECKASAYQYFQKLRRHTSPTSPDNVPDLYHELRRMSRLWRWMKKLKWAGAAHKPDLVSEAKAGELANFCPACPQPGINLPENWPNDPQRYYSMFIEIYLYY